MRKIHCLLLLINFTWLANISYAATDDFASEEIDYTKSDPYERFNRSMFKLHKTFDNFLLKPTAKIYDKVVPRFGKIRIHNFLQNLTEPINFINGLLQLDAKKSTTALSRFIINSTLGLGGIHDVAASGGISYTESRFSDTLKYYKFKTGPFLIIPILGLSSIRDATAYIVDMFTDPIWYIKNEELVYIKNGILIVDKRVSYLNTTDYIEKSSIDEYATYRSLYLQKN